MTAVSSVTTTCSIEATSSEDVQLPSLSCSDHDGKDILELTEDNKVNIHSNKNQSNNSRTVSPLLQNNHNSGNLSFDELHDLDNNNWDDEVVILDLDGSSQYGDDTNMEDVLSKAEHNSQEASRVLLLDSDIVLADYVGSQNRIPFVDEFLVTSNDYRYNGTEADLNLLYSRDFQVPPPTPKSFLVKVVSKDLACNTRCTGNTTGKLAGESKLTAVHHPDDCSSNTTANTKKTANPSRKRTSPTSPSIPSASSLEERYRKRLCRLEDSMRASHKTRRSLRMTSPVLLTGAAASMDDSLSDRHRRTRLSQVLYSIDCSSYRLDTCHVDPSYFISSACNNERGDESCDTSTLFQRSLSKPSTSTTVPKLPSSTG